MWETVRAAVEHGLGLEVEPRDLTLAQMGCRAIVVFLCAVAFARVAARRVLGRNAGFDIVLLVVLGSVLSRGINGEAAFFPTLGVSALLLLLHHVVATLAFRSHRFSGLLKGRPCVLVRQGKRDEVALRQNKITHEDLEESLRLQAGTANLGDVEEARLERNGSISVVPVADRKR